MSTSNDMDNINTDNDDLDFYDIFTNSNSDDSDEADLVGFDYDCIFSKVRSEINRHGKHLWFFNDPDKDILITEDTLIDVFKGIHNDVNEFNGEFPEQLIFESMECDIRLSKFLNAVVIYAPVTAGRDFLRLINEARTENIRLSIPKEDLPKDYQFFKFNVKCEGFDEKFLFVITDAILGGNIYETCFNVQQNYNLCHKLGSFAEVRKIRKQEVSRVNYMRGGIGFVLGLIYM